MQKKDEIAILVEADEALENFMDCWFVPQSREQALNVGEAGKKFAEIIADNFGNNSRYNLTQLELSWILAISLQAFIRSGMAVLGTPEKE